MAPLTFRQDGRSVSLAYGERFARPREAGFRDAPSSELLDIVAEVEGGRPWREVVGARYAQTRPWLHAIVASGTRTAFFNHVLPAGDGPVLDIGSGWGQIARPLARHRPVVALEPVAERLAFIQAAARQDGVAARLAYVESDYLELDFDPQFAAICAIGVLEWAGAFQTAADPQERQRAFLAKTRRELAPGGSVVLGIENRLGLKYLLGCPDDHVGIPGLAVLDAALARQRWRDAGRGELQSFTYSHAELDALLRGAGYTDVAFYGAYPDYKLPQAIVPFGPDGRSLNAWLASASVPREHNGYDGSDVSDTFQRDLASHYGSLAREGVAHVFAPSFFVRAR
jgi:hypothetical protein